MKIESTAFTRADMAAFADQFMEHERAVLADRLEADSARLAGLIERAGAATERQGGEAWSAHDVLAHIAVFSKFYGMLTYKVGSGQMTEIDLLDNIQKRDVVGAQLAAQPAEALLQAIRSDHRRTVEYLRAADAAAMRRRVTVDDGRSVSADEIARLFLCAHLEQHLDQLEQTLRA